MSVRSLWNDRTVLPSPPRAGEYRTVVSDPPWRYDNSSTRGAAEDHYLTMSIAELKRLPVAEWIAPSAHLYLWTTTNFLERAFSVMRAWGFEYVTNLVWVKPQMGMGNYFRISHEHILFGASLPRKRTQVKDVKSWFKEPRAKHSAKPESFYDLVERSSEGPYLDMFGRPPEQLSARLNGAWDLWGLEADGS